MSAGGIARTNYSVAHKSAPTVVNTGSARECRLAGASNIPFDYVPPPEGLVANAVPYKWPSDEEWTRTYEWHAGDYEDIAHTPSWRPLV